MAVFALDTSVSGYRVAFGQHTTVAAVDTLTFPGISVIDAAVANFATDAADANLIVTTSFSGGTLTIKTWKTDGSDPTPAAATAFSKLVNYLVIGH